MFLLETRDLEALYAVFCFPVFSCVGFNVVFCFFVNSVSLVLSVRIFSVASACFSGSLSNHGISISANCSCAKSVSSRFWIYLPVTIVRV